MKLKCFVFKVAIKSCGNRKFVNWARFVGIKRRVATLFFSIEQKFGCWVSNDILFVLRFIELLHRIFFSVIFLSRRIFKWNVTIIVTLYFQSTRSDKKIVLQSYTKFKRPNCTIGPMNWTIIVFSSFQRKLQNRTRLKGHILNFSPL